jgi:hypothetical protein
MEKMMRPDAAGGLGGQIPPHGTVVNQGLHVNRSLRHGDLAVIEIGAGAFPATAIKIRLNLT